VDGREKRELGENAGKHVVSRAPNDSDGDLLDQVANVVVLDVDIFGLRSCHGVGRKGNATFVVLEGSGRSNEGKTNSAKELTEKHGFLRGSNKGHVLGLGGRKGDTLLESTAPRNEDTKNHSDEAGARVAVNAVGKGGVLPDEGLKRDGAVEGEAELSGSRDVAEDAFGLFPVTAGGRAHEAAEEADIG
jgi:hypothetical protein